MVPETFLVGHTRGLKSADWNTIRGTALETPSLIGLLAGILPRSHVHSSVTKLQKPETPNFRPRPWLAFAAVGHHSGHLRLGKSVRTRDPIFSWRRPEQQVPRLEMLG